MTKKQEAKKSLEMLGMPTGPETEGVCMFNFFDHAADNDAWNNLIHKGLPKMSTRQD